MANTNRPNGFTILGELEDQFVIKYDNVKSGDSFKPGDPVFIDSNGYQTSTSGSVLGIALTCVLDTNGEPAASGGASNNYSVHVYTDPNVVMTAQITTYAITAPYTCATRTGCFDIAGATGVKYIDAGASSTDDIIVMGLATETNDGMLSEVGAYAKVKCMFSPARHLFAKNS